MKFKSTITLPKSMNYPNNGHKKKAKNDFVSKTDYVNCVLRFSLIDKWSILCQFVATIKRLNHLAKKRDANAKNEIYELIFVLVPHSLYSADLAPIDYCFFFSHKLTPW